MGKMKPGFKFSFVGGGMVVVTLLSCILFTYPPVTSALRDFNSLPKVGVLTILGIIEQFANALPPPPQMFHHRLGAPMPELGRPAVSAEDDDSEEDDEDILESGPGARVEPHITPLNRDQCLAKLLCGMSVPVTGGNPKRNYYSEYANTVSKFFDAFPLDDELQSKESIETYDDYSNEDDDKPTRINHRRKPLNSSRVEATTPKLHLFDLALVDVAKPEDLEAKNRTKKGVVEKVQKRNRMARARKIVENLGQKLQTVRQCQSIDGCPFTFKQLKQKLRQKEAQRVSSNVLLHSPVWSAGPKNKQGPPPTPSNFQSKPPPLLFEQPEIRPRPKPQTSKPEPLSLTMEMFPKPARDPVFPHRDTNKGDDELEEIFGPPKVSKRPLGFHQGVDENFNYEYNPDKPWRPGSAAGNSYGNRPWKPYGAKRPKPNSGNNNNDDRPPRPPQRPRPPRPQNGSPDNQSKQPPQPRPVQRRPGGQAPLKPVVVQQAPKRPNPPPPAEKPATKKPGAFPKKKISYLSSPYRKPSSSGEDDEGAEDINKVAPVELVGNSDAGESEPSTRKTTTTEPPTEEVTEGPTFPSKKKKKQSDDSDEYEDDDYYSDEDDVQDDENESEEYDEEESEEEDEEDEKDKEIGSKKDKTKKRKKEKKEKRKKSKGKKKNAEEETETVAADEIRVSPTTPPKKGFNQDALFDDENENVSEIWTKLNYATTGANYKPLPKLNKKEKLKITSVEETQNNAGGKVSEEESAEDDDDEEDEEDDGEEEGLKGSLTTLQKVRASSSSVSHEEDADDEVDDENQSKQKKRKTARPSPVANHQNQFEEASQGQRPNIEQRPSADDDVADDIGSKGNDNNNKKSKKKKKKPLKKQNFSEEEEENDSGAAVEQRRKQNIMMEIGGRPLVPKPEHEQSNAQKTSNLIANRFKFQFINPYMGGPQMGASKPMDGPPDHHSYSAPLRSTFGAPPTPQASSQHHQSDSGNPMGPPPGSSLPFKIKLNAGPLGNLAGGFNGPSIIPLGGFGHGGGSGSASLEMPDPHFPPPPTPFAPHNNHGPNTFSRDDGPSHQQQQNGPHFSQGLGSVGLSGFGGGSNLFKLNPIPALTKLFKKPSQDGHDGHSPPPSNAFIHRPIGPESSQYRRDRLSPASGSSNPAKKGSKKKAGKGKKTNKA